MTRPIGRSALLIVLPSLLAAFLLWAFAWPAARIAPRDLPLGVAGPDSAVARVEQGLAGHAGSQAFTFHWYADAAAAKAGVEDREVYGAVVSGPHGPQVLTASAASPAVATLLQQAAARMPGGPVPVTDLVPLPAADPRGAAFAASVLPTVVVGVATGALASLVLSGLRQRLLMLGVSAAAVGTTAALIGNSWLGMLTGSVVADAGVVALVVLAVSAAASGMGILLRHKGLGLVALLMMLLGNAWSGVTSAPELLPGVADWVGRLLPPGAGAAAERDTAFFDGHGVGGPLLVLVAWAVFGLFLTAIAPRLVHRRHPAHAFSHTAVVPTLVPDEVEAARR